MLICRINGEPVTQGSLSCYFVKALGRCVIPQSPKVLRWRKAAQAAIRAEMVEGPYDGPVRLHGTFYLSRPKSVTRALPFKRGFDLDKGVRALMDALTDTVVVDDSQVVRVEMDKKYVEPGQEPGVVFGVTRVAA